jgi:AcrR family transcriptional regulator
VKRTRARSTDAKQKVFTEIIHKGRELFLRFGAGGFTLRALANELDMGQASLYTYFKSKRELWFAIVEEDFKEIENQITLFIENYSGRFIDLPVIIAKFYFDAVVEDYRKFRLIFKTSPPKSSKKGPIEQQYEINTIKLLVDVFENASKNGEIKERETTKLAFFVWNLIYGTMFSTQTDSFGTIEKIPYFGTLEEYFYFALRKIEFLLNSLQDQM